MRTRAIFGPAGKCDLAAGEKCKSTGQLIEWLAGKGADAFEYQCGRGVNIGAEKAEATGSLAAKLGIELSLHAPYYISLASSEKEKRYHSIEYILESARVMHWMGGGRIVVHPGGLGGLSRHEATKLAAKTLEKSLYALHKNALDDVIVCPELMGKVNQLGNLREILEFCKIYPDMLPCIDFGHLNSRNHGKLDYADVLDEIFAVLGEERAKNIHIHFSKIEYSAGGELRHLTFADEKFGPDPGPLMAEIARRQMTPTVICESAGTQTTDALWMKENYLDRI